MLIPSHWDISIRLQKFENTPEAVERMLIPMPQSGKPVAVHFAGGEWTIDCSQKTDPGHDDAVDIELVCQLISGAPQQVNAGLVFGCNNWSETNYVMIPAAAYKGNRFQVRAMQYPPIVDDPADTSLNPPTMITDVPRLELDPGVPSNLHLLTGDATTPCLSFYSPGGRYAAMVLTDQGGPYGNHGLQVLEDAGRQRAELVVEAPGMRAYRYGMVSTRVPSPDRAPTLAAGDVIRLGVRLYVFPATCIQDLFDRFAVVRKDLSGDITLRHSLPFSAAWAVQEQKYNEWNWNASGGYYAVGTKDAFECDGPFSYGSDWQLGWVGGAMVTHPLLFQGSPQSRARALANLDWLFSQTQLPGGFFAPSWHKGRIYSDHFRAPQEKWWTLIRKQADALYFLVKQCMLLEKMQPGWTPPVHWLDGLRKLCDCLSTLFEKEGQLGQFVDLYSNEIVVGGSTSAGIAPAGLALAGQYLKQPRYITVAEALAHLFHERDMKNGVTTGGPGEMLQCPDSESAFGLLESLVVLHEVTGKPEWLGFAQAMAAQCMSWCASYDYRFPAESCFGRLGMHAASSVWANVQNKHSAPGICTLSGDSLFKLWRATGNLLYLDLIQEIAHNLPQYLSRADRPVGGMKPGFMCERVNFSDWEGVDNIGGMLFGSCWCEVSLALTTVELPGIYLQPDTGFCRVFDHVVAEVSAPDEQGVTLHLRNPTAFDARVRLFVETLVQQKEPLGQNAMWGAPELYVPAGGERSFSVSLKGCVKEK